MPHPRAFTPRLLPAPSAAHYIGVSETKLRSLRIPRRLLDGKRLYHVLDLDAYADALPVEGETAVGETNSCDEVFDG